MSLHPSGPSGKYAGHSAGRQPEDIYPCRICGDPFEPGERILPFGLDRDGWGNYHPACIDGIPREDQRPLHPAFSEVEGCR